MTHSKNILLIVLFFAAVIALGHYAVITVLIGFFLNFLYECYEVFILKKEPRESIQHNNLDTDDYALPTLTPAKAPKSKHADLVAFRYLKNHYLHSPEWQSKRKRVLTRDRNTCQSCGAQGVPLHVHHQAGYNLIPHEPLDSLVSLCEECHTKEHQTHGYPQTYDDYMTWNHPIKRK